MPQSPKLSLVLISTDDSLRGTIKTVANSRKLDFLTADTVIQALSYSRDALVGVIIYHLRRRKSDVKDLFALHDTLQQLERQVSLIVISEDYQPEVEFALLERKISSMERPLDVGRLRYLCDIAALEVRSECEQATPCQLQQLHASGEQEEAFFYESNSRFTDTLEQVKSVIPQTSTILLTGETGTGKTRLAQFIHKLSPRRHEPFLTVNCGALSSQLIESEIFGHVKGAFTGADRDRQGKLTAAASGTFFLDEVNSLPLDLQGKLLQAIDERVFSPVGSNECCSFDARLIVATNDNLADLVNGGKFRPDLYYRFNVIEFTLPPLRERSVAIRPLAEKFLAAFTQQLNKGVFGITKDAAIALEAYNWPGNIRELSNVMQRAVALCRGPMIQVGDLPDRIREFAPAAKQESVCEVRGAGQLTEVKEEAEAARIIQALKRNNNNRQQTALELGISRMTLYTKLRRYGLMASS